LVLAASFDAARLKAASTAILHRGAARILDISIREG
jgi:hypothetical protein